MALIAFFAAAFCGLLAGMGLGGGSLLILYLTNIAGFDPASARGINLLFFLPAALLATLSHIRHGKLPLKKVTPAVLAGTLAAALFSFISVLLDIALLRKLFGVLLLGTGVKELYYRPRKAK